jgi:hypothetical protein
LEDTVKNIFIQLKGPHDPRIGPPSS